MGKTIAWVSEIVEDTVAFRGSSAKKTTLNALPLLTARRKESELTASCYRAGISIS